MQPGTYALFTESKASDFWALTSRSPVFDQQPVPWSISKRRNPALLLAIFSPVTMSRSVFRETHHWANSSLSRILRALGTILASAEVHRGLSTGERLQGYPPGAELGRHRAACQATTTSSQGHSQPWRGIDPSPTFFFSHTSFLATAVRPQRVFVPSSLPTFCIVPLPARGEGACSRLASWARARNGRQGERNKKKKIDAREGGEEKRTRERERERRITVGYVTLLGLFGTSLSPVASGY